MAEHEGDPQVTVLLRAWRAGDDAAREALIAAVYPKLRALAGRYLGGEAPGHTLSATALVHEAYLRMAGSDAVAADRVHFFAIAARVMRHILVDHARARRRDKRGGGAARLSLDAVAQVAATPEGQLVELDDALTRLAGFDRRKAELVELLYFGGLNHTEAAKVLDISEATVQRDLRVAKAWLYAAMSGDAPAGPTA